MPASALTVSAAVDWTALAPASAVLQVQVDTAADLQLLSEDLRVDGADLGDRVESGGGSPRALRVAARPGPVSLRYEATVTLGANAGPPAADDGRPLPGLDALALELLPATLPSRFCPSDLLEATATAQFGPGPHPAGLLEQVRQWVHDALEYSAGVSDAHTAADATLLARAGVCRDFAHLTIALLRALGVPARMVAAYALDLQPPDFHAVVEAHDGERWRLLDPTGLAPVETLVRIATGRDAADIAWATTTPGLELDELSVRVRRA